MKLIKLEINNFRQFYGKQFIEFSTDDERSVTLIHGENNGGKTALLNALKWCLYEETTENLQDSHTLMNKHALADGKNTFSVTIQLIHDNRILEVMRTATHAPRKNTLKVYEINSNGCYAENSEKYPNTLINSLLPKEMSEYFFYQGEGTGTLSSQNDFNHIKGAISKVLGLTVAEKTLSHLNRIKNEYIRELTAYDTDDESEVLSETKDKLSSQLIKDEAKLKSKLHELVLAEKEYESNKELLRAFDKSVIEEKIKSRDKAYSQLKSIQGALRSKTAEKEKSLPYWLLHAFTEKINQFDLSQIDINELKNSHKYSVDKQLIKEIISNHECICGSPIEEGSDSFKVIAELKKSAVDVNLKHRWHKVSNLQSQMLKVLSPKQQMLNSLSDIEDCHNQIHQLEKDINDLSQTIVDSDVEDIKRIEGVIALSKDKYTDLLKDVSKLELSIERLRIDLVNIDKKLLKLASTQPKALKIRALIESTDQVAALFHEAIEAAADGVDLEILKKMKVLFSRVAFNGYSVRKAPGQKDSFTWVIVDKEGKKVAAGNGYQAMLAISFIIALIQFSKDRAMAKQHLLTPGAVAPFIADSILAFIGPDNGRELVKFISESVEQSIFMFSQAQWTESHTDKGIRAKIGKEYNLVQHTVLTKEEFKGEYPTKLKVQGIDYDVVRFGSEYDKVTIEEVAING